MDPSLKGSSFGWLCEECCEYYARSDLYQCAICNLTFDVCKACAYRLRKPIAHGKKKCVKQSKL